MTEKNKVTLLWSGGWDGTFRLLQLATNDIIIQPIYVIDEKRGSTEAEIRAMNKILEMVKRRFLAEILEIKFIEKNWILDNCADENISKSFKYIREKFNVGIQYEWFALLAKHMDTKMESAVVHQYNGKIEDAIKAEGVLMPIENDFLPGRMQVLPKGDVTTVSTVFENLILPVITMSKKDEEKIARENGWLDIMKLSWFCHTPINGEVCGLCGPCDDAMNTGMEWRVPEKARKRYKHRKIYISIRKIKKKLGI